MKHKLERKIYKVLLLIVAFFSLLSLPVKASPRIQNITLSPTHVDAQYRPGSVNTGTIQITNLGTTAYTYRVYAAPYSVEDEQYTPNFSPQLGTPDVSAWFSFTPSHGYISPDQSVNINYTVNIPTDARAGSYFSAVFAQTTSPPSSQGVALDERVGAIFYIVVPGKLKQSGNYLSWEANIFQTPPVNTTLKLDNTGSEYYYSDIHFSVADILGNNKYSLETKKHILPQTIRAITLTWPNAPAFGLFKLSGSATIFNQTVKLPTRYVLVMSSSIKIGIIATVLAIGLFLTFRELVTKNANAKKL